MSDIRRSNPTLAPLRAPAPLRALAPLRAPARALRAVAQPWTLALVVLLLVNDHVLRVMMPSWVTGKLGDVAWLGFAPLVVAVPLALWPRARKGDRFNLPNRTDLGEDNRAIWVAIALVGIVFAVVKTVPAATSAFSTGFAAVFGWTPLLVCDPTDLLTLPALAIAWALWRAAGEGRQERVRRPAMPSAGRGRIPRRAWWVLGLAALATLGNSGPPDEGILCLAARDGQLYAGPRHAYALTPAFVSADGGLTWRESDASWPLPPSGGGEVPSSEPACPAHDGPWTLPVGRTLYRFAPGTGIDASSDDGATWTTAVALTGDDARVAYYQATRSNISGSPGPHDALVDPVTGNLVVAMGQEGALVHVADDPPTGGWQWVALGEYRFEPITRPGQVVTLLKGELGLLAAAVLVGIALGGWGVLRWPGRVFAVGVAIGILVALVAIRPATVTGYAGVIVVGAVAVTVLAALPLAIIALARLGRSGAVAVVRTLALGLDPGILGVVVFVLWALGVIPTYTTALWISVVALVVAWTAAASGGWIASRT